MAKSNGDLPFHQQEIWRTSRWRRGPLTFALVIFIVLGVLCWPTPGFTGASITVMMGSGVGTLSYPKVVGRVPTSFLEIRNYERNLPQHDLNVTSGNGFNGRVLMSANEIWGLGLNNQLDDRLLLSHLALLSNRSYVFSDVMFGSDWNTGVWQPLNTFISGPTAGGELPPYLDAAGAPRAISREMWEKVCPSETRKLLKVVHVNEELGITDASSGIDILEKWAKKLRDMPQKCVEIKAGTDHIFDFDLFGDHRLLSLYPSLSTSPTLSAFRFSNVVLAAVERNTPLITGSSGPYSPAEVKITEYNKTIAIHVRRGDFDDHCYYLARTVPGFASWSLLPRLPDRYRRPDIELHDPENKQQLEEFMNHCWPDIDQMVRRVRNIKREYESSKPGSILTGVYILTNGERDWLAQLKIALLNAGMGIERVVSSRDLDMVTPPEKLAKQAVDMEVGVRSAVLIGNGFSTMTANMILLRLMRGHSPDTCRLW